MIPQETLSKVSLDHLKSKAELQGSYRFFDSFVDVHTNIPSVLSEFDSIYRRFRIENAQDNPGKKDLYLIFEDSAKPRIVTLCDDDYQVMSDQSPTPNLYLYIFSYITPKVTSHYLVHASTISYRDQATIITAHSTAGKTTLAVELLRKGFKFLSDELAPIHRKTHLIDPFPRNIGLRDLRVHHLDYLASDKIAQSRNAKGEIKFMIDPEVLCPGSIGSACAAKNVIFLEPQYEEKTPADDTHEWEEIALTRLPPSLLRAIQNIAGVLEIEVVEDRIFPLLRVMHPKGSHILNDIEEAARVYQSGLVSIFNGKTHKPNFSAIPALKGISKFEGTVELAKMILNAHPEAVLMNEMKQSSAYLLTQLADITQNYDFYQLRIGRLDLMTKIVDDLIRSTHGK